MTADPAPPVLAVNCGSTSFKAAVVVDGRSVSSADEPVDDPSHLPTIVDAIVSRVLAEAEVETPAAVGHRVVHGGPSLTEHVVVDGRVRLLLEQAVPFAPLHLPPALVALDRLRESWPQRPHVACFDTAFFADLPLLDQRLPIPEHLHEAGIRRYGFHGLSYEWVAGRLGPEGLGSRAVIAHLGGGSSLAALLDGRPVHTTMGLTPTGGVLMGTRTGDLDPGVLLHLLRAGGMDVEEVAHLVDHDGGVAALSGGTSDNRRLVEQRQDGDERAGLALAAYVRSVAMAVGASAAVLGGLDSLTFTGGIGEHAAPMRDEVLAALEHLHPFEVHVVPDDEQAVIARHTTALAGLDRA